MPKKETTTQVDVTAPIKQETIQNVPGPTKESVEHTNDALVTTEKANDMQGAHKKEDKSQPSENVFVSSEVKRKKTLPLDMIVPCINGTHGGLTYCSRIQMGYEIRWSDFGDVQDIELKELQAMRNGSPAFFKNNWILFPDDYEQLYDVLNFLRVEKYYQTITSPDDYDALFLLDPEELKTWVAELTNGARDTLKLIVAAKVESGELDSLKQIGAFEAALGCKFDA